MKCANCANDAMHLVNDPGALPQAFCDADLPEYLRPRANIGALIQVGRVVLTPRADPLAAVKKTTPTRKKR